MNLSKLALKDGIKFPFKGTMRGEAQPCSWSPGETKQVTSSWKAFLLKNRKIQAQAQT